MVTMNKAITYISLVPYIPMIYNLYKTKKTDCISYTYYSIFIALDILRIANSILNGKYPPLISTLIHVSFYIIIVLIKYRYESEDIKKTVNKVV